MDSIIEVLLLLLLL